MWLQDSPTHSHMLTSNTKSSTCGNLARIAMNVNLISFAAASGSCHSGHSRWMKTELSTDGFDLQMFLNHWLWCASKVEVLHLLCTVVPRFSRASSYDATCGRWLTGTNSIIGWCTAEPGYDRAKGMEVLHLCCTSESSNEFEIKF